MKRFLQALVLSTLLFTGCHKQPANNSAVVIIQTVENNNVAIAKKLRDATVRVYTDENDSDSFGSGFTIVTANGEEFVITAGHVVVEQEKFLVLNNLIIEKTLYDEHGQPTGTKKCLADLVKWSHNAKGIDIAILKLQETGFAEASLEFSDRISNKVGESAFICGNPLHKGLANTVSLGIVSGKGRHPENVVTALDQFDFSANPGCSGGPIVGSDGKVIAILVRGISETVTYGVPTADIIVWMEKYKLEHFYKKGLVSEKTEIKVNDIIDDSIEFESKEEK